MMKVLGVVLAAQLVQGDNQLWHDDYMFDEDPNYWVEATERG